jgi:hypothetical protein
MGVRHTVRRVLVSVLCCAFMLACSPDTSKPQALIQAAYDAQSVAYAQRSVAGVVAQLSPKYEDVNGDQADNLEKYTQVLTSLFLLFDTFDVKVTIKDVKLQGDQCVVRAERHFFSSGTNPKTQKLVSFRFFEVLEDTWEKTGTAWLKRRSVVLESHQ